MSAPAFRATGLFLWSRNRTNLLICAVGYGTLFIGAEIPSISGSPLFRSLGLGYLLFTPLVFPLMMFIGPGLSPNAELINPEGQFPRHFFVLPVAVPQLVLPFMLYATLFSAAQWSAAELISDGRVLAFLGGRLWIPLLGMSFIAWLQALLWTPVRSRRVRALQLFALMSPYVFVFVQSLRVVFPAALTVALSIAQFPIAYAAAMSGVAKSRRGDPSPWAADGHDSVAASTGHKRHRMPHLPSPFAAQLWMERNIHRWAGKSFLVALLPAALLALTFVAALSGAHGAGVQTLGSATIYLLFGSLVLIGISTGMNFGSFQANVPWNQPAAAYLMPAYFATLPFSSGDFAWAKIRSAAARMLWVSAWIVLLAAIVAEVSGYAQAWMAQHTAWRAEYGLAATVGLAAVPPLALVMLTLSATTNFMWLILLGRSKEFSIMVLSVCWLCVLAARFDDQQIIAFLSVFIPFAAGVKVCILIALLSHVGSRRVLSWPRLIAITGFWATTAGTLVAWLWWYAPQSLFTPMRSLWTSILIAPVLGTVAAPLALARNRAR
jgi:hypothetical protein